MRKDTAMRTITINEWTDATTHKPWQGRVVIVRTSTGAMLVARWNGKLWINATQVSCIGDIYIQEEITHFYIFEKYIDNDEIKEVYTQNV